MTELTPVLQPLTNAVTQPADRRKFIGGSDIAAILGISPWRTAADLWLDKITPPTPETDTKTSKRAKARGTRLEPYILDMIQEEHGITATARNARYIDTQVPHFACEIDAEAHEPGPGGIVTVNLELKTVHPFMAKEWGDLDTDSLPLHYLAQVQWGLGVTQRSLCRVFALIGDDLRPYVVRRDDETIDAMRRRAEHFWNEYVARKVQPPLDYADSRTLDTLRRLYPGTDGSTINATAAHEHWRAVLETAQEMVKKYEGVVDGAKAHLLAEMGNAALLRYGDGKAFRRKEVRTKAVTIEKPAGRFMDFRLVNLKEEA